MLHLGFGNLRQPKIIPLGKGLENIDGNIRPTKLLHNGPIGPIAHINRSKLFRTTTYQRLRSFERMHMVFINCHHAVFIEVGDPVEEGVEETGGVAVEVLAHAVDWHVVVYEF